MIEQQVRAWGVLDEHLLNLMSSLPRENFVPAAYKKLAFSDTFIPIGHNQVMLSPKITGRILQALAIDPNESVLEIGSGTGYLTALLCQLAKKVTSIEIFPDLSREAEKNLRELSLPNVTLEVGDGIQGFASHAPYDVIILTGSVPFLPKIFREQLQINGRLFAILGESPAMSATLLKRVNKKHWTEQVLFETDIPPLLNVPKRSHFQF